MEVPFTFLSERYGRRSVLITSNLVFSERDRILKDSLTKAAAIDRLIHNPGALGMVPGTHLAELRMVPGTHLAELLTIGSHNSAKCVPGTSPSRRLMSCIRLNEASASSSSRKGASPLPTRLYTW